MIDACPAGGSLLITLWDVYATPRRPDGDVWDGFDSSSGLPELLCDAAADLIRRRARDAANAALAGAGTIADRLVGEAFAREVADACGLAADWLQMAFEGPDLFAFGWFDGDPDPDRYWETIQVEDTWAARLNVTWDGWAAAWEIPCDDVGSVAALQVVDSDLAKNDAVGTMGLDLAIPDDLICNGWAYYEGFDGIAGVLVRLTVVDAIPTCY